MCLAQGPQRSDASEDRTRGPSVSSQALYHCAPIEKFKINLDPSQATMVVSQTPCIHIGIPRGGGGGAKLITFSHIKLLSQQNIACTDPEGGRGPGPTLEKHKLNWIL